MTRQDDFARCLTRKLLTYGLGRELAFSDRGAVETIDRQVASQGNGLRALVHAIVRSEIFHTRCIMSHASLSLRTFLRGTGISIALPFLER
jgi:hypothetical protein